jgi:molecular chaperone GrpE
MPKHSVNDPQTPETAPDTEGATDPATTAAETATDETLATIRREKDTLQDLLLRTAAEFDNYRKRVDRERREQAETAAADVLGDLLPIIDDLERALQAMSGEDAEAYRKGVELIYKQMMDLLRKRGVTPIEATGATFDPRYHQAVIHEVSDSHRDGEVIEELRRGYMLGDRLLRPAMVKVARA